VIHLDTRVRDDAHAVQAADHREQPRQHPRHREVRAQRFLGQLQALVLEALRVVGDVPGRERTAGELLQFPELALGGRTAHARQVLQELDHLGRRARHLGGQRVLGEVREADDLRRLVAQREDLGHQRRVVPLARVRAAVRGTRHPGLVEVVPQRLVGTVRHHGLVGGGVQ